MGAIADVIIAATDPITALLVVLLGFFIRRVERGLHDDIEDVKNRVERLENTYITDGGKVESKDENNDG